MALGQTTYGRVTGHLANRLYFMGQQQRACSKARGRSRGLGAGVTAANDNDVIGP
jgi:hypothetical protein